MTNDQLLDVLAAFVERVSKKNDPSDGEMDAMVRVSEILLNCRR